MRQWITTWVGQSLGTLQRQSALEALRDRLQRNPNLRFTTLGEVVLAAQLGLSIDANRASIEDWLRLPGLSIHQARRLEQLQQSGVVFHSLEDVAVALGVSLSSVEGFAPVLRFYYYEPSPGDSVSLPEAFPSEPQPLPSPALPLTQPLRINPNLANLQDLYQVPGIGEILAREILHQRIVGGPFRNLADFQQRLNLPGHWIGELMHYLRF